MRKRDGEPYLQSTHQEVAHLLPFTRMTSVIGSWYDFDFTEEFRANLQKFLKKRRVAGPYMLLSRHVKSLYWDHPHWDDVEGKRHPVFSDGRVEWHVLRDRDISRVNFFNHIGDALNATRDSRLHRWTVTLTLSVATGGLPYSMEIRKMFLHKLGPIISS